MTGVYRAEVERDGVRVMIEAEVTEAGSYADEAELGEATGFYATRLLQGRIQAIERRERLAVEEAEEVRADAAFLDGEPVTAESTCEACHQPGCKIPVQRGGGTPVEVGFCKDPGPLRYTNGDPILCVLLDGHAGPHTDVQGNDWQIDPWATASAPAKVLLTDRRRETQAPF